MAAPLLLIGDHPLLDSMQAGERKVVWPGGVEPSVYRCMIAFREDGGDGFNQDSEALTRLKDMLAGRESSLLVEILVHDTASIALFEHSDLNNVEFMPFTLAGRWAETLLGPGGPVRLDGEGISYEDNRKVRLVLFGMTPASEALAVETLKIAHFPNYVRDHSLRTRITWIGSDAPEFGNRFVSRYKSLMDASYYSFIDLETGQYNLHKPDYEGRMEDFVDVEWEFVHSAGLKENLRTKLKDWSEATSEWRTVVVFAMREDNKNIEYYRFLKDSLVVVPVLLHIGDDSLVKASGLEVIPFGMPWGFNDNTLLNRRIAMAVNEVYTLTARYKRIPDALDMAEAGRLWAELPGRRRRESLDNARSMASRLLPAGMQAHGRKDLRIIDDGVMARLAEVEHNRWTMVTLLSGMRPATVEEQKVVEMDIKQKRLLISRGIHYDLRPYSDLRADETGNDTRIYDIAMVRCLPLIASAVSDCKLFLNLS